MAISPSKLAHTSEVKNIMNTCHLTKYEMNYSFGKQSVKEKMLDVKQLKHSKTIFKCLAAHEKAFFVPLFMLTLMYISLFTWE